VLQEVFVITVFYDDDGDGRIAHYVDGVVTDKEFAFERVSELAVVPPDSEFGIHQINAFMVSRCTLNAVGGIPVEIWHFDENGEQQNQC
jgi:hypothetical protein